MLQLTGWTATLILYREERWRARRSRVKGIDRWARITSVRRDVYAAIGSRYMTRDTRYRLCSLTKALRRGLEKKVGFGENAGVIARVHLGEFPRGPLSASGSRDKQQLTQGPNSLLYRTTHLLCCGQLARAFTERTKHLSLDLRRRWTEHTILSDHSNRLRGNPPPATRVKFTD